MAVSNRRLAYIRGFLGQGGVTLSCPGFHGQLISRHFHRFITHWRLVVQRLM